MTGETVEETSPWRVSLTLLLGVWLLTTALFGLDGGSADAARNALGTGVIVTLLAVTSLWKVNIWEEWINFMAGLWLIGAPFVFDYLNASTASFNHLLTGGLLAMLTGWSIERRNPRRLRAR